MERGGPVDYTELMEAVVLNQILVRLLIFALHLAPVEMEAFSLHVLDGGLYAGTYRAVRVSPEYTEFRVSAEGSGLRPFEAEKSRRYGHIYTVYGGNAIEGLSVGLSEELGEMRPFAAAPRQILSGAGGAIRVDSAGRNLFLGVEETRITVVAEFDVSK